jgi:hypothetical protein
MMPWLVAMTNRHARARAELQAAGFEAYTPLTKEKRTVRGRRRWLIAYLFGRYFFVRQCERWPELLDAEHVDDLIRHDDGSIPTVRDAEIDALRAREISGFISLKTGLRPGQRCRAVSGLMMGRVGTYIAGAANDREAAVFDFMGQASRIEFAPGVLVAA